MSIKLQNGKQMILGSGSPRRKKLLSDADYDFDVIVADVEEKDFSDAVKTVEYNARLKNQALQENYPEALIITADTTVCFEGRVLGKPESMGEAQKMLLSFAAKSQKVYTAVTLACLAEAYEEGFVVESEIKFKSFDLSVVKEYHSLVYPLDKAGAYNLGEHPDLIIDSCIGSETNIIGLPMDELKEKLKKMQKKLAQP